MSKFIIPQNSRIDEQKKVMTDIAKADHCPFCQENLAKYHKSPIIKDGKFWVLTKNQWPYEKVKHQLLAIYKKHIEHISEIENGAGDELLKMFSDEAEKRKMPGGGVAMRFGNNPGYGNYGSTVFHLHAHLIEPDLEIMDTGEKWKFKFGENTSNNLY